MFENLKIRSAEYMIKTVRHFGIIPFFKCGIPGWSIEELTPPEHWFFSSDELGPWDWKIDVVREGDIAYGKFLGGKAAFSTVEFYAHLMNYRRSLPKYRIALGEKFPAKTKSEKLLKALSPAALSLIRENGCASSTEIRMAVSSAVSPSLIRSLGVSSKPSLVPSVKKSVCDSILQFLEMGTWTVIGDFTRVYRGPSAEYTGWQRSSHTTPDALFAIGEAGIAVKKTPKETSNKEGAEPFWARFINEDVKEEKKTVEVNCSPEESREFLAEHIRAFFPETDEKTLKKIL